ncbi:MAG: hypothetical protein AABX11_03120 [Nanoarchaeota archaeon]
MNEQETQEREELQTWMEQYSALTGGSLPLMLPESLWNEGEYQVIPIRTETTTLSNPQRDTSRANRLHRLLGRRPECYTLRD